MEQPKRFAARRAPDGRWGNRPILKHCDLEVHELIVPFQGGPHKSCRIRMRHLGEASLAVLFDNSKTEVAESYEFLGDVSEEIVVGTCHRF